MSETNLFEYGKMYPLIEPDHYDDDFDSGCGYALVADETHGVNMYIVDCWIVNADGHKHKGYDAVPIPVSRDMVDLDAGVEVGFEFERGEGMWR